MVKEVQKYIHFHGAPSKGKILMVASSPSVSKQTSWPIGFWAAELTHPLRVFQEAGYEVTLASTEGGTIAMDTYSDPTDGSGYSAHDVSKSNSVWSLILSPAFQAYR
jgi:putative intracellular protease/amidase